MVGVPPRPNANDIGAHGTPLITPTFGFELRRSMCGWNMYRNDMCRAYSPRPSHVTTNPWRCHGLVYTGPSALPEQYVVAGISSMLSLRMCVSSKHELLYPHRVTITHSIHRQRPMDHTFIDARFLQRANGPTHISPWRSHGLICNAGIEGCRPDTYSHTTIESIPPPTAKRIHHTPFPHETFLCTITTNDHEHPRQVHPGHARWLHLQRR